MDNNKCDCGSGQERYAVSDARGIFCFYGCEKCEDKKKSKFRPEIFEDNNYEVDEQIDEDY